jgi:hypothetical protein
MARPDNKLQVKQQVVFILPQLYIAQTNEYGQIKRSEGEQRPLTSNGRGERKIKFAVIWDTDERGTATKVKLCK